MCWSGTGNRLIMAQAQHRSERPVTLHDAAVVARARERGENFPVALRILPRDLRDHLHSVYAVVRTIDDLGDEAAGDRTALLHEFASDLRRVWTPGRQPQQPVLQALVPTVRACGLAVDPFEALVEANLLDQRVTRYQGFDDLLGYCRLSAEPIGRLVLALVGRDGPAELALSDQVCTALQLLEHWQDVAEDRRHDRVYLPLEDLARFGVAEHELDAPTAGTQLRRLVLFETDRAQTLLTAGLPLVRRLDGWSRLAVAGYVAGGRAAVRALRRTRGDVLGRSTARRHSDLLLGLLWVSARAPRTSAGTS
jgi:squalene synthase HpnC